MEASHGGNSIPQFPCCFSSERSLHLETSSEAVALTRHLRLGCRASQLSAAAAPQMPSAAAVAAAVRRSPCPRRPTQPLQQPSAAVRRSPLSAAVRRSRCSSRRPPSAAAVGRRNLLFSP